MSKKCILLCRVSTDAQEYEAQIVDLKKYALTKGYDEYKVIATKESGFLDIERREGWEETKKFFLNNPDYSALIVTEISRLGRRETSLAEIKEYIEKNKKSLYIKDLDLQLYDEGKKRFESDIVFSVFASIAISEMSQKKERFLRKRRELTEQGYSIVGKELFGYKRVRDEKVKKNKFVIDPKEAKEIQEIYDTYLYGIDGKDIGIKGLVLYAVAKGMSPYLHSKRNMTKLLSERAYLGGVKEVRIKKKNPTYWKFNDHTKPKYRESVSNIPYPAIISQSTYDAVQKKKLNNRTNVDKSRKHETILSKLIECPSCHTFLIGDYRPQNKTSSYRCAKHKQGLGKCDNSSIISMPYVDSLIWCYLKTNVKQIIEEIYSKNKSADVSSIECEIANYQDRKKVLQEEAISKGTKFERELKVLGLDLAQSRYNSSMSVIEKQMEELDSKIELLKRKISDLIHSSSCVITDEDMEAVERDKGKISEYIHILVRRIICYNTKQYTFIRVVLNGDDEKTFRGIIANKRDTQRIVAYGFKRENNMPFSIINQEQSDTDGNIIEWVEGGSEVLEKMVLLDSNLELYPIPFRRLQVYEGDLSE